MPYVPYSVYIANPWDLRCDSFKKSLMTQVYIEVYSYCLGAYVLFSLYTIYLFIRVQIWVHKYFIHEVHVYYWINPGSWLAQE